MKWHHPCLGRRGSLVRIQSPRPLFTVSNLELVALVVRDYDAAIHFFVDVLQFELVEDTPSLTNDGRPKTLGRRATQWRPNGYPPCAR